MEDILIPIIVPLGICVALPVLVVWLVMRAKSNSDNKRAQVLIEAIRNNADVNPDKLTEALGTQRRTPAGLLQLRLLRGCIFTLLGVASGVLAAIIVCNDPESHVQNIMMFASGFCLALGISYLIVYFVTRKGVQPESDGESD